MADFSHFNDSGRAWMVDVSAKSETHRTAVAAGRVLVNEQTYALIKSGGMKKGDVLGTALVGGIMAAERCFEIIPMWHPLMLSGVNIDFEMDDENHSVGIRASVKCLGVTGVEMEALTAVSAAALTVYDMCKAVQRDIEITDIRLLSKSGGKSGDFVRDEA